MTIIDLWPLLLPALGAIVWIIRLEGRLNVNDQRYQDIIERLQRIERLIDQLVQR